MTITVKLAGVFRVGRFKEASQVCPAGCKVTDVVAALQLPEHLLGIVLINGRHASATDSLQEGDILSLLPLLDGG